MGTKDRDKAEGEAEREQLLSVLLAEYEALKSEQLARIGFRDNLLYATIAAVGALGAVALGGLGESKSSFLEAFLLVPWVTTILGWTYLVNDDKITDIRSYVDDVLAKSIKDAMQSENLPFRWETYHRSDPNRGRRKGIQLGIDLVTFVVSGLGALLFYVLRAEQKHIVSHGIAAVELLVLLFLAREIVLHHQKAQSRAKSLRGDLRDGSAKG